LFLVLQQSSRLFSKVISRTNLGLDQEAAQGTLTYKKKNIRAEIAKIFGIRI